MKAPLAGEEHSEQIAAGRRCAVFTSELLCKMVMMKVFETTHFI